MRLSEFINGNMDILLQEWEAFARTVKPPEEPMSRQELRDWADGLLHAIAEHLAQDESEPKRKHESEQQGLKGVPELEEVAHAHAMERMVHGFRLKEMTSEYHALRTTVMRLWLRECGDLDRAETSDLVHFNELVDKCVAESVDRYSTTLDNARDLLVGILAHDLRDPLSVVSSSAEVLLLLAEDLESVHTKTIVRMRNSVNRMHRMIADLLDFTRTRLGERLPVSPEWTHLGGLCSRVVGELSALYPDRRIDVHCAANLEAYCDPHRVEQMLSNLISNALKHGGSGPVTISVSADGDEIVMAVHNHGEPIPPAKSRVIFDPLVRGLDDVDQRKRGSLGLGLYISKEVAEAHGGSIDLESTKHSGTTFTARLRRLPAGETKSPSSDSA